MRGYLILVRYVRHKKSGGLVLAPPVLPAAPSKSTAPRPSFFQSHETAQSAPKIAPVALSTGAL